MNEHLTYETKLPPLENELRKEFIDILTEGFFSSIFAIPSIIELYTNKNSLDWVSKYEKRKEIIKSARTKLYQIMIVK